MNSQVPLPSRTGRQLIVRDAARRGQRDARKNAARRADAGVGGAQQAFGLDHVRALEGFDGTPAGMSAASRRLPLSVVGEQPRPVAGCRRAVSALRSCATAAVKGDIRRGPISMADARLRSSAVAMPSKLRCVIFSDSPWLASVSRDNRARRSWSAASVSQALATSATG